MKYIAMIKSCYGFNARVCENRKEAENLIEYWKENLVKSPDNKVKILLAEVKEEWEIRP